MSIKKISVYLILMLVLVSSVFSATITSASDTSVKSNYDGFDGLSMLFSVSSSPSSADSLIIRNDNLPDEYVLEDGEIQVRFLEPEYAQIFQVNDGQVRLYRYSDVLEETYFFTNTVSSADTKFKEEYADIQDSLLARNIGCSLFACTVYWVEVDQSSGYIAPISFTKRSFEQDIELVDINKRLTIKYDGKNTPQLSDSIDNVASVTFTGFTNYLTVDHSANDIIAYDSSSAGAPSNQWVLFEDNTRLFDDYVQLQRSIGQDFDVSSGTILNIDEVNRKIQNINNVVDNIKSKSRESSSSRLSNWDNAKLTDITRSGNEIRVPLNNPTQLVTYQLLLSGDSFSFVKNTGEPSIISPNQGQSINIDENLGGTIEYVVQNRGDAPGSFVLNLQCDNNVVGSVSSFVLDTQESKQGLIDVNAKSSTFAEVETQSCSLIMQETQTKETDSVGLFIDIETKDKCTIGEKSDPFKEDNKWKVIQYTSTSCDYDVILECDVTTQTVNFGSNGIPVCTNNETGDTVDDQSFNPIILIITSIVSLALAIYVYIILQPLDINGVTQTIRWIITILIFVGIFIIIPLLIQTIVNMFTLF